MITIRATITSLTTKPEKEKKTIKIKLQKEGEKLDNKAQLRTIISHSLDWSFQSAIIKTQP